MMHDVVRIGTPRCRDMPQNKGRLLPYTSRRGVDTGRMVSEKQSIVNDLHAGNGLVLNWHWPIKAVRHCRAACACLACRTLLGNTTLRGIQR